MLAHAVRTKQWTPVAVLAFYLFAVAVTALAFLGLAWTVGRPAPAILVVITGVTIVLFMVRGMVPGPVRRSIGVAGLPVAVLGVVVAAIAWDSSGTVPEMLIGVATGVLGGWAASLAVLRLLRRVANQELEASDLTTAAYESDAVAVASLLLAVGAGMIAELGGQFVAGYATVAFGALTPHGRELRDHPAANLALGSAVALLVLAALTFAIGAGRRQDPIRPQIEIPTVPTFAPILDPLSHRTLGFDPAVILTPRALDRSPRH